MSLGNRKRKIVSIVIITMLMLPLLNLGGIVGKANEETLKVAMEVNYAPFNWSQVDDKNGAYPVSNSPGEFANGYDVAIAKKLADGLGRTLEIVKTEWDGLAPGVMSGKFDAIIAGMSPTPERRAQIDFSDSYYTSDLVLVVKKGSKYENANSIADDKWKAAKVTGQLNTFHYSVIDQIKGAEKLPAMEDFPAMIVALKSGKIDAYVSERPGAMSAQFTNPDLTYVAFDGENGFKVDANNTSIAVGLKKNSPLTKDINVVLSKISEDERKKIMQSKVDNESDEKEAATTNNKDEFTVAMEVDYAPFNWSQKYNVNGAYPVSNSTGEYANGYDVQIAKKLADGLGKKLVIIKNSWDGLAPGVMSGKFDAIIAGMSPTSERRAQIDFSERYYTSDLVVVVDKNGKYANAKALSDLNGAKVTGQLNTFHYTVIDQISGVEKLPAMEDFPSMIAALSSGKIDGYVSERPGALSAVASNPNLTFTEFEKGKGFDVDENDTSIAVGLKKGSEYREKINEILKNISEKERLELMNKVVGLQLKKDEMTFFQSVGYIINEYGSQFLRGAGVTLLIAIIGTIIGFIIGLLISILKLIPRAKSALFRVLQIIMNFLLNVYIEIFRGTPMIVQAMLIYYGSKMFLNIDMQPLTAALLIVSVNTGAYLSEIVRGGISAIDIGQFEAAKAIGMKHSQAMFNIILPQAIKNILPAIGNEFVINIKDTAVLNVISVTELYFASKSVAGSTYLIFQSFFVTCVIYFVLTFSVTRIIKLIEKKMAGNKSYSLIKEAKHE